jgi:hypothetical protein
LSGTATSGMDFTALPEASARRDPGQYVDLTVTRSMTLSPKTSDADPHDRRILRIADRRRCHDLSSTMSSPPFLQTRCWLIRRAW